MPTVAYVQDITSSSADGTYILGDTINIQLVFEQDGSLLDESNSPNLIDFLSLDVEGAEIEVLKGINHKEYRFKLICIESRDIKKIKNFLEMNEYLFLEKLDGLDYLFKDKNLK